MCTLEQQDSMARAESGGNPKLNAFKDIPTSSYVSLTSKNAFKDIPTSTHVSLTSKNVPADPITKKTNNGKKIKIMI